MKMTLMSMIMMNFFFLFTFHPLSMILILLMQTLLVSTVIFYMSQFPWMAYTLILVFLGGLLVLFSYMSNVASNEMFKTNLSFFIPMILMILMSAMMPSYNNKTSSSAVMMKTEMMSDSSIMKPFSSPIMPLMIFMAIYIILTMLAVVKMSKMDQGPLRLN
uniref:NADH dehydrogenase subunit 6 n=1 Tax=Scalpellum stearnsi TaxID=748153 RepID=UPI00286AAC84|nr:NADH dehydrogenase subunit 6 [Scalpellum stearnsi]WKB17949.1 NADH dehydrogenase subunit 6 [Scalpellum stearnsi]